MDRVGTEGHDGTDNPCRALVVIHSQDGREAPIRLVWGGRPMAGFLAQLIVDTDPTLRVERLERTRNAATLYAQAAIVPGGRRRA